MNITLLTYGSRGDVQPFVALGVRLQGAGHRVRLAAPERFADFVASYGLDFAPLIGDPAELSRSLVDEGGGNFIKLAQVIRDYAMPRAVTIFQQMEEACADADAIVYSFLLAIPAHYIARRRNIPDYFVHLQPIMTPTVDFPPMLFPQMPVLTGRFNRVWHTLFNQIFWQSNRFSYQMVRRQHPELPPRLTWPLARNNRHRPHILYAISPHILPFPPDWDGNVHLTGYWYLENAGWTPPEGLQAFIDAAERDGERPIYVGFGSMVTESKQHIVDVVRQALTLAGKRAVWVSGWGDLTRDDLPSTVYTLDSVPHDWLFPRVSAIVHHGGAGTAAAAFRAGVPGVILPFFGDQFFWAERGAALGVNPPPIISKQLTAEVLAQAIHMASGYAPMAERAAALGAQIRAEDGIGEAVRIITGSRV